MTAIADAFLNTRADHLPSDLFNEFIVPLFFQRISIFTDKKSVRILGGRGCGKTIFIRYFCHGSTFSRNRSAISDDEFTSVGLYMRPDTGFCSLMRAEWLGVQEARLAFSHYIALNLLSEACAAVRSIDAANLAAGPLLVTGTKIGTGLTTMLGLNEPTLTNLETTVEAKLIQLELWARNPLHSEKPLFLSFDSVLPRLANDIAAFSPRISKLGFRAFIDEFENLQEVHREIICDAIKHPSDRLKVHIAHKREAVTDFKTSSQERVVEKHDLRTIDLEKELSQDGEFELLAAELFLFRLHQVKRTINCAVFKPDFLHDPIHLPHRLSEKYRKDVIKCVREILPTLSAPEIAQIVVSDEPLRRRLREMIKSGLALQGLLNEIDPDKLIDEAHPQASIVLGALLNRKTQKGRELLETYFSHISGKGNDDAFSKVGGWIDNNLYGCLFYLYAGLPRRKNIMYSGFDRFCRMSSPNLRFFQELCHTTLLLAFQRQNSDQIGQQLQVEPTIQAAAAKQVSDVLFADVQQLGQQGVALLEIARRLGLIFEAFNSKKSQSEPEINHFSIDYADQQELSEKAHTILREAKIWSVLYEEKDTKGKSDYDVAQTDLILNSIFAPHFSISYRKRRKVMLKAGQVDVILCQSTAQFDMVLKRLVDLDAMAVDYGKSNSLF